MVKLIYLLLVLAAIGAGGYFYLQQPEAILPVSVGNLNIYIGQAAIVRDGVSQPGATGSPVYLDDTVRTSPDSRASIILKDGSVIRLDASTELRVEQDLFKLVSGRTWSKVQEPAPADGYQVETPTLVGAVRGTSFLVSYLKNVSQIYVGLGEVFSYLVSNQENIKIIKSGQLLVVSDAAAQADFDKGPLFAPPEFKDEWIIFNEKEDGYFKEPAPALPRLNESRLSQPLPPPLPPPPPPPPIKSQPQLKTEPASRPEPAAVKYLTDLDLTYKKIEPAGQEISNGLYGYQTARSLPSAQFTATASYSDNSQVDVTSQVQWSVSGTAGGKISPDGLYQPATEGRDTVSVVFKEQKTSTIIVIP